MKDNLKGIRHLAARVGLNVGCHPDARGEGGQWGPAYLLQQEFDSLVSNAFHWCALQPDDPGKWNWAAADKAVNMAHDLGLALRGHAILWYQMLPRWFSELGSRKEMENHLIAHIQAVVTRYRGKIVSWDVANETIWLPDGKKDGLRVDPLSQAFGEEYLDLAFQVASEADPGAELVLNEALLVHEFQSGQREAFAGLMERLVSRGAPVHAAGIQAHINWDDGQPMGPLAPRAVAALLSRITDAGLGTLVTELDVFDAGLADDPSARDLQVAELYTRFLDGILGADSLRGIYFWGCGDAASWYNTYVKRVMPGRLPGPGWQSRPLLFDTGYHPKAAYFAVARCLEGAILPAVEQETRSQLEQSTA